MQFVNLIQEELRHRVSCIWVLERDKAVVLSEIVDNHQDTIDRS
jgi:hypothetical protein